MKQVIVGTYDLGAESVVLILRPGMGGDFHTRSDPPRKMPCISVGADSGSWQKLVAWLVHEVVEVVMMRMGLRYVPDVDYARDAAGYLFVETHAQHSEVCARVGWFLADCLPDLNKAWKKWKKAKE